MIGHAGKGAARIDHWRRKSSRWAFLFPVLLLAACQSQELVQVSEFPHQNSVVPESITIVCWNAQKGAGARFTDDLVDLITVSRPDFVFLQEARVDLLKTERIGGYFAGSWSYPWPNGKTIGLLTLSKVPPGRILRIPSKHREFFVTAPKLSLATEYPLSDGRRLLAINVHILAFERWQTAAIRSQLGDLQAVMEAHTGPIVFIGDFNTWSHQRLDVVQEVVDALELIEVDDFPPGRRLGDKENSFWNSLFGIDEGLPLDRVYYRGFTHHSAKVLTYESSDHRAFQVTLVLESRPQASAD